MTNFPRSSKALISLPSPGDDRARFTASASFTNSAITVARSMSDTFAGIRPQEVSAFILAKLAGAMMALMVARVLFPTPGHSTGRKTERGTRFRSNQRSGESGCACEHEHSFEGEARGL